MKAILHITFKDEKREKIICADNPYTSGNFLTYSPKRYPMDRRNILLDRISEWEYHIEK